MLSPQIGKALATVFGRGHKVRVRRLMPVSALAVGLVLFGAGAPALGYGDHNNDGTIDLTDYGALPTCLAGPGGGLGTGCDAFDFDSDTDVDIFDFAAFQRVFGTSIPEGMVLVPAGEFAMGDPWSEGGADELPVHTVYLSPYYIDAHEVTNQQYCDGLNWAYAEGDLIEVTGGVVYQYGSGSSYPYCDTNSADADSRIHWDGATFSVTAGKEDHPMVEVGWYGAVAYSNWRSAMEGKALCYDLSTWACNFGVVGYRLPTEAEWEKAAGWDPVQERHFRFGEHSDGCGYGCLDGERANSAGSGDPYEVSSYPQTTPAVFYNGELHHKVDFGWPGSQTSYQTQNAQSYYGCYDMSGNVYEWCHDWHSSSYYSSSPGSNPTGPGSGTYRILRGGHWGYTPSYCRSAIRHLNLPAARYDDGGFRCAVGT
jgi:sulfatase modifying factor 1